MKLLSGMTIRKVLVGKLGWWKTVKFCWQPNNETSLQFLYTATSIVRNFTFGGTFDKGLSRLVKLQKKAIRLITGANRMYHCEPRQKKLGLLKLEDIYKLQVNCFTYDCLNSDAPDHFNRLFMRKRNCGSSSTRSQTHDPYDIKLQIPESMHYLLLRLVLYTFY